MDFFGGLTYDHLNFIFSDSLLHNRESMYPTMNTSLCKFGFSEHGRFYYDYGQGYVVNDPSSEIDGIRRNMENLSCICEESSNLDCLQPQTYPSSNAQFNSVACTRIHQNTRDYEVFWQDDLDPDSMTYEELLELGESVGTQSRGLSQDLISLLPVSKFKRSLFSRKRSRKRCVVCQMEYKRGDRQMTLPCKHVYHVGCGSRWLSINKACPICYKEVSLDALNQ